MAVAAYVGAIGGAFIGLHIPKSAFNPIILVLLVVVGAFVSTLGPLGATIGRGLMVAGASLLVAGALAPTPKRPQTVESDPTYSLSSGANPARIREPIPVLYGTVMMTPDLRLEQHVSSVSARCFYQLRQL